LKKKLSCFVSVCASSSLSFDLEGGGPHPQKVQKPPKGRGGCKGPKKGRKDSEVCFAKKKKGKKEGNSRPAPAEKRKKRDARTTHFSQRKSFLLPVFGYFFPGFSLFAPSISPAVLLPRGGEERERERERVKGREEEEDFVHTFF